MLILRSILFYIILSLITLFFGLIGIPLIFTSKKLLTSLCEVWANTILMLLKVICNLEIEVKGTENIPPEPLIIASKHESAIETVLLWTLFKNPALIMKKEVLFVPVFGAYCHVMGMISIDRGSRISAMKKIITDATATLKSGRSIIMFPEGTRIKHGESVSLKSGVKALHTASPDIPVIPVAVNSGKFLPKGCLIIKPGVLILKILEPMNHDDNSTFLDVLQSKINTPCNNN
jgi:1-acyl-sn-glycerol-3-phosphate acyltransferase